MQAIPFLDFEPLAQVAQDQAAQRVFARRVQSCLALQRAAQHFERLDESVLAEIVEAAFAAGRIEQLPVTFHANSFPLARPAAAPCASHNRVHAAGQFRLVLWNRTKPLIARSC